MAIKTVFYATGTFTVPSDFSSLVYVAAVGPGGNGFSSNVATAGGGGGGAYAESVTVTGLSAGSTIYISLGAGGGDAWLNTVSNAPPTLATQGVLAKGGSSATSGTGGQGGQSSACVGTTVFSGGNGGSATQIRSSGGGGGAANKGGNGGNGGNGSTSANTSGGGGGSAALFTAAGVAGQNGSSTGGRGGYTPTQTPGNGAITGTTPALPGIAGGGGGGGTSSVFVNGSYGGNGLGLIGYNFFTAGSGGGGGGGGNNGNGGNGGSYGGGGGGGTTAGTGGAGYVVLVYNSSVQTTRYWVGGTGTWDSSSTTHWSATSGGLSGASAPDTFTNVIFDNNSGSGYTVTMGSQSLCQDLTFNGTNSFTVSSTSASPRICGSFINNNPNVTFSAGGNPFNFYGKGSCSIVPNNLNIVGLVGGQAALGTTSYTFTGTWNGAGIGANAFYGPVTIDIGSSTVAPTSSFGVGYGVTIYGSGATINQTNALNSLSNATGINQMFPLGSYGPNYGTMSGTFTVNLSYSATGSYSTNYTNYIYGWSGVDFNILGSTWIAATGGACKNLNFTGFTGTWIYLSSGTFDIYGDLTVSSTTSAFNWSSNTYVRFRKASGTQTITTNGVTLGMPIIFGESSTTTGTTFTLADNLTVQAQQPNGNSMELVAGTLNANNRNVSTGIFKSSNSNVRTLTMGSGTWTLTSGSDNFTAPSWDLSNTTNLTFNVNTANIVWSGTGTSTEPKSFKGGGLTYNNLTISGGTGIATYTFSGNNTFSTLSYTKTVAGTFKFTSGSTTTVSTWSINGTSGAPITINSTSTGSQATLIKSGAGTVNMSYTSIQDSNASPSNTWYALLTNNNTNLGNNTGWVFSPVVQSGNFLMFF